MEKIVLPPRFPETICGVYGEEGQKWLEQLGLLLQVCEHRWALEIQYETPYTLSYNYVTPVVLPGGAPAVLKLGVPGKENRTEIEALSMFAGEGMVRLLDADPDQGLMLLEKVMPGVTLDAVGQEEEQTRAAVEVLGRLRRTNSASSLFPTVADWFEGLGRMREHFHGGTGPLPEKLVELAEAWSAKLISTIREPRLLHGDLHHGNILSAAREPWLAIDPKGVIGETEYECIAYLRNHLPKGDEQDTLRRRVEHLVKGLDVQRDRVLAWGLSHSILSAWWHLGENTEGWEDAVRQAEWFELLLKHT